jgi:hypothetical protein
MALARTAVVLSRGIHGDKETLSVGILSNLPYEDKEESPTVLQATIDVRSATPIDGNLSAFRPHSAYVCRH